MIIQPFLIFNENAFFDLYFFLFFFAVFLILYNWKRERKLKNSCSTFKDFSMREFCQIMGETHTKNWDCL